MSTELVSISDEADDHKKSLDDVQEWLFGYENRERIRHLAILSF